MAAKNVPHAPERIGAFYSRGPHYLRMLNRLRAEYPEETIVAIIPKSFPPGIIEGIVNETLTLDDDERKMHLLHGIRAVRLLRRARCSHIVVMFDSPRLNLLARLSRAAKRWCFTADGRLRPLSQSLPQLLLAPVWLRLCGQIDYMRARMGTARRSRSHD